LRRQSAAHGRAETGHYSGISKGSQNFLMYNFIITTFDCQGSSQGGEISAKAFALAHPGVAPPLSLIFKTHIWPVLMARLAGVSTGHKWPA